MPYRGVIFDLYGTLIDGWDKEQANRRTLALAQALEVPAGPFQALMEATYTERATAALGDLPDMLLRLCRLVGHEPTPAALARAETLRTEQFREVLSRPREETPSLLATLRSREVGVGVISDSSSETPLIWPTLRWADPVQVALFSWTEGRRKPAPELYLKALSSLEMEPNEVVYVGDGGSHELSGATAVGLLALRVVHHPDDPEAHLQYDPDSAWRGREIGTLSEVLSLFG
ncbi:MAG: HAD hydrolase-like protein [Candidatus Dormibacteraeota bacterium]|nr:HAD hydrolase-like protein [Candidatus Dormibacteraeota bacterium]